MKKFIVKSKSKLICYTACFTALNVIMSASFMSVPVPGGHLYLNDIIIVIASILLDPFSAFIVGGIGSFLGDAFFYPTPMFVSLATHGLQAVAISLIYHSFNKHKTLGFTVASLVGAIIMVTGYSLGRAFIYSTVEYAILKLPFQITQAVLGAVIAYLILFTAKLMKALEKSNLTPYDNFASSSEQLFKTDETNETSKIEESKK